MCKITKDICTRITILIGDGREGATEDEQFYLTTGIDDVGKGVDISEVHINDKKRLETTRYWLRDIDEVEELAWALKMMAEKLRLIAAQEKESNHVN